MSLFRSDFGLKKLRKTTTESIRIGRYFLDDLKQFPVVSNEEIHSLFRAHRETGDRTLQHKIVCHNLRLIVSIAKKHPRRRLLFSVNLFDLVQEGFFSGLRAVDRYDVERGASFSTYLGKVVYNGIHASADRLEPIIRVPQGNAQKHNEPYEVFSLREGEPDRLRACPEATSICFSELRERVRWISGLLARLGRRSKKWQAVFRLRYGLDHDLVSKQYTVLAEMFGKSHKTLAGTVQKCWSYLRQFEPDCSEERLLSVREQLRLLENSLGRRVVF